jgi:hypothetical protein
LLEEIFNGTLYLLPPLHSEVEAFAFLAEIRLFKK